MQETGSFLIKGQNGNKSLSGTLRISGAKNAALKAMAASILFEGPVRLDNIPETNDIDTMERVLTGLGASIEHPGKNSLEILAGEGMKSDIDPELAKAMRASVVLTGPMLARFGNVTFPAPGGCVIGARPIDLFLDGYAKMGAKVEETASSYMISADQGLTGTNIIFSKVSVGATETLMMAAVLARGTTILENCAMEPEIANVAEWLNACGAKISGHGTPIITIVGSNGELLSAKASYRAIPDRIEAGSYLFLGSLLARDLVIEDCRPDHLETVISLLRSSGVPIETTSTSITISGNTKPNSEFKAFDVKTHEYPGFPTDLQSQATVFLTQVDGESMVQETIFEGRFKYIGDLKRMGASITEMNPLEIAIKGPAPLASLSDDEILHAPDIRAGFALIMASLCAEGVSRIDNINLIDRGYELIEERLSGIGADIKRM